LRFNKGFGEIIEEGVDLRIIE